MGTLQVLAFATLSFTLLLGVNGTGPFQSYNNDEREKHFRVTDLSQESENEINSHPLPKPRESLPEGKKLLYDPNWESIDSRPLPQWYDQSKVGIFIHWGVYSVPGVESEWFWKTWTDGRPECVELMEKNYKPGFTYQEFAPQFTAEFYDPSAWADLFNKSGARYVVLTSKHHEGYTLWPSKYSFSWNAIDVGPHRDLLGDLANAIRANTSLRFGLYHSLYEWYNPLWMKDKENNLTTDDFVSFKIWPEMIEVVEKYQPDVLWSDGEWEAPDSYWRSLEFLAWLYNESPVKDTVVTNDRWGSETLCKHGGYYTCADRFNPGTLQPHKWENCFTLDKESWGFRRDAKFADYMTPEELMSTIVQTVACGGNALVNVGPNQFGMIPTIQEERLLQMGEWLDINGEAIYNSKPWVYQNDTITEGIWYTTSADDSKVYGMITSWPDTGEVRLGVVNATSGLRISMLGQDGDLDWGTTPPGITVTLPTLGPSSRAKWVWTLVIREIAI